MDFLYYQQKTRYKDEFNNNVLAVSVIMFVMTDPKSKFNSILLLQISSVVSCVHLTVMMRKFNALHSYADLSLLFTLVVYVLQRFDGVLCL